MLVALVTPFTADGEVHWDDVEKHVDHLITHGADGIVVVEPASEDLTVLAASLHNHGIAATVRAGHVRLSPHASTDDETLAMLRAAFISYSTSR